MIKTMHMLKPFSFMLVSFFLFFAGCSAMATSPQPTVLQVTRINAREQSSVTPQTWVIKDTQHVQQLFNEIQQLPVHQNHGADSCARPMYNYHLQFLAGTQSIQEDDLYKYCFTLTLPDGSNHDPSDTFTTLLASMLHLSTKDLRGFA